MISSSVLAFDADTHTYRRPDGERVPSVTQVLRAVGVSADFEDLKQISPRVAQSINYKRDLGTALHADAHALDDDDLDWSTVHPDVEPYLRAWQTCRENLGLFAIQRERRVYSPTLGVCGTLDGIFYRSQDADRRILIDLKVGDPEAAGARYQLAGYELLWTEEHPDRPIAERWSVQLTPAHRVPYRITNYTAEPDAWQHIPMFRAFVTTYWHQAARRRSA